MDFYISIHTVKKLENTINNYKRRIILMDFYKLNNIETDYSKFEDIFLNQNTNKNSDIKYNPLKLLCFKT